MGFLTITAADVSYIIQCAPVMVAVRASEKCHNNLPIRYEEKELFMETIGRIIVHTPEEIPCSRLTPPKFKIANKWLKLERGLFQLTEEPIMMAPQKNRYNIRFSNLKNILLGGIYTNEDLEKFNNFITFPQKQRRANQYVTGRIISENSQDINMGQLFTKKDLSKLKNHIFTNINESILVFGSYMGAIIGICALLNIIRSMITTATNFYLLRNTLGNGIHLLGSCFTSVTNYLLRNNYEQDRSPETEMRSLNTTAEAENENEDPQGASPETYRHAREQMHSITIQD